MSVSLSIKANSGDGDEEGYDRESREALGQNGNIIASSEEVAVYETVRTKEKKSSGVFNMTKHLWAGAVAAMVSRFLFLFIFFSF